MKVLNPDVPNFLDEKDSRFIGLRGTRDTVSRSLRAQGVGASVKHTSIITHDEEDSLWVDNPTAVLNTVFYMNGKVLCLRGGTEHKLLKIGQFSFGSDDGVERVIYTENGSKNRSGSYKDSAGDNKIIKQYADQSLNDRCYVSILKLYIQKFPHQIPKNSDSVQIHGLLTLQLDEIN